MATFCPWIAEGKYLSMSVPSVIVAATQRWGKSSHIVFLLIGKDVYVRLTRHWLGTEFEKTKGASRNHLPFCWQYCLLE